jgi:DNA-binding beta-propeller fold protein YncE
MHGIGYDPIHDEIVVPQAFAQAVLTFRGGANGEEAPIRVIQGPLTQLKAPDRMAIDPVNNEIYIVEQGYILVFPREANGNVAPIRKLEGPDTGIAGFSFLAVDPVHNVLIHGGGGRLRIFDRTANGNVKPKAIIGGPKSGFNGPNGAIAVHAPTGMIIASSRVSGRAGSDQLNNVGEVAVFSVNDSGDVRPRWTIGRGFLKVPRGVAVDPEGKNLIVSDKVGNRIVTFNMPEIFGS